MKNFQKCWLGLKNSATTKCKPFGKYWFFPFLFFRIPSYWRYKRNCNKRLGSLYFFAGCPLSKDPPFSLFNIKLLNPISNGLLDSVVPRGGTLEHWYVTLRPKWVISMPNGHKITQFYIPNNHNSSKMFEKNWEIWDFFLKALTLSILFARKMFDW